MAGDPEHPRIEDVSLTQVLAALADPVRLAIVETIASAPHPLPCGAVLSTVAKSTASHHWKVLREAGVIRQTRSGTSRLNEVRARELERRFPGLLSAVLSASKV